MDVDSETEAAAPTLSATAQLQPDSDEQDHAIEILQGLGEAYVPPAQLKDLPEMVEGRTGSETTHVVKDMEKDEDVTASAPAEVAEEVEQDTEVDAMPEKAEEDREGSEPTQSAEEMEQDEDLPTGGPTETVEEMEQDAEVYVIEAAETGHHAHADTKDCLDRGRDGALDQAEAMEQDTREASEEDSDPMEDAVEIRAPSEDHKDQEMRQDSPDDVWEETVEVMDEIVLVQETHDEAGDLGNEVLETAMGIVQKIQQDTFDHIEKPSEESHVHNEQYHVDMVLERVQDEASDPSEVVDREAQVASSDDPSIAKEQPQADASARPQEQDPRAPSVESSAPSEGRVTRSRQSQLESVQGSPPLAPIRQAPRQKAERNTSAEPEQVPATPTVHMAAKGKGRRGRPAPELLTQIADTDTHPSDSASPAASFNKSPSPEPRLSTLKPRRTRRSANVTPTTPTTGFPENFGRQLPPPRSSSRSTRGSEADHGIPPAKSTPTRRSARLRDSSLPDGVGATAEDVVIHAAEAVPSAGQAASPRDTTGTHPAESAQPDEVAVSSTEPKEVPSTLAEAKAALSKDLRSHLSDLTSLKNLRHKPNGLVDVICVATATPGDSQKQRTKHVLTVTVTDPQVAPSGVVQVVVSRPFAQALPVIHQGDTLLIRKFKVQLGTGRGAPATLQSTTNSSWAVFERGRGDDAPPQIKGPAIEWTSAEQTHANALERWWDMMDEKSLDRLAKAARGK
jgi:hypothetical protein